MIKREFRVSDQVRLLSNTDSSSLEVLDVRTN